MGRGEALGLRRSSAGGSVEMTRSRNIGLCRLWLTHHDCCRFRRLGQHRSILKTKVEVVVWIRFLTARADLHFTCFTDMDRNPGKDENIIRRRENKRDCLSATFCSEMWRACCGHRVLSQPGSKERQPTASTKLNVGRVGSTAPLAKAFGLWRRALAMI